MKKIQIISVLLTLSSANIFAQDASGAPSLAIHRTASLYDIIINSGPIGITIWILIFLLIFAGVIIGILSIRQCRRLKNKHKPLSFKLLPIGIVFLFTLGLLGTTIGATDSFACLGNSHSIFCTRNHRLRISKRKRL